MNPATPKLSAFAFALRQERCLRSLSIDDVAKALLLSDKQITGLESDDLSYFYTRTYAERAAISYATLLKVDLDLEGAPPYSNMARSPIYKPVLIKKRSSKNSLVGRLTIPTVVIGVATSFGIIFVASQAWLSVRSTQRNLQVQGLASPVAGSPNDFVQSTLGFSSALGKKLTDVESKQPATVAKSSSLAPIKKAVQEPIEPISTPASSSDKSSRFFIVINRSTAVNARDAGGRSLISGNQAPTKGKRISGVPPFSIEVADPDAVEVYYLGSRIRPGRTDIAGIRMVSK